MANTELLTRVILRNDTAANWSTSTIVLRKGEPAIEIDEAAKTGKIKFGDGVSTYANLPYSTMLPTEITSLIENSAVQSVSVAPGTDNGTIKLTVDGTTVDNIKVTGLGSAAYTDASAYATAEQGAKADAAMPIAGGTFTGPVTLAAAPTEDLGAATKQYVDSQITASIAASDAMVFKGTFGTDGTVTALPTDGVVTGDTYKVTTAGTVASAVSASGKDEAIKVGDLVVAMGDGSGKFNGTWIVVPSGNEEETFVKYSKTENPTLNETAQSGTVIFGEAAIKQVDSKIDETTAASVNVPTTAAVKTYVDSSVGATTDENVQTSASDGTKAFLTGTSTTTTTTGHLTVNTNVFVDAANKVNAAGFVGDLTGTADAAKALTAGIAATVSGGVTGSAAAANAGETMAINVTKVDTDYLANGSNTLVLNGGSATTVD